MIYADENDIYRCTKVVREELNKKNVKLNESVLYEVTVHIMNISYAKGGDYSDEIIRRYAEIYINRGLYNKFLKEDLSE